jgi:hypothetical protein
VLNVVVTPREVLYVGNFCFSLDKVLMDIGVLHSIYILKDLDDKRRESWRGKVIYAFWRSKTEREIKSDGQGDQVS